MKIDVCGNCMLRGDIEACEAAPCSVHDNWYSEELKRRNELLRIALRFVQSDVEGLFHDPEAINYSPHIDQYTLETIESALKRTE